MSAADLNTLRTRDNDSDVPLDCTFVSAGGRAYYNRGVRYRGRRPGAATRSRTASSSTTTSTSTA